MSGDIAVHGPFGPHVRTSKEVGSLLKALFKVQGQLPKAVKDAVNPHLKNKYADLESCWDAALKPLQDNGITVNQIAVDTNKEKAEMTLTTAVIHAESGEYANWDFNFPLAKTDAHGVGSAITYASRYSLCRFLGICPSEDDGNAASKMNGDKNQNGHSNGSGGSKAANGNQQGASGSGQQNRPNQQQPNQQKKAEPSIGERFKKAMDAVLNAADNTALSKIEEYSKKLTFDDGQLSELNNAIEARRDALNPRPVQNADDIPF